MNKFLILPAIVLFSWLVGVGCAKPWTPPLDMSAPPSPKILIRTPHGLVPEEQVMTHATNKNKKNAADGKQEMGSRTDWFDLNGARWSQGEGQPEIVRLRLSRPIGLGPPQTDVTTAEPITPQYYYIRPEHTSTGYIEGRYGRVDNFTPGEHTSTGYTPGHYRADGLYTRPEHTSTGYIPGHYRAELQPNAASMIGTQTNTSSTLPSFRPYGGSSR